VFDNIYVLVGQGAGGETTSLSIYIYEAFFKRGDIGLTMATSLLLFVVAFTLLYLGNRWRTRREAA
jgi:multiple sugar transport system permease protein